MPDIIQHYYESDVYRRGSYSDLTHEIALVRKEIEAADNLFQNASDPDLIDSYIFQGKDVYKRQPQCLLRTPAHNEKPNTYKRSPDVDPSAFPDSSYPCRCCQGAPQKQEPPGHGSDPDIVD